MEIGIVIPAYNEGENLVKLVNSILGSHPQSQIIIVDDSADEKCVQLINDLTRSEVTIVHRKTKGGRGSAVLEGVRTLLKNKSLDYILEIDADFSHPPEQIPEILAKAQSDHADMVIASRYMKGSSIVNWPVKRKIFSAFSNKVARTLLKVPVSDYTNGYRLYSRRAADEIVKTCGTAGKGFIALSEILINLYYRNFVVVELPTRFVNRTRGESSLSLSEILGAIRGLVKIYFMIPKIKKANAK
ncbi:MAG: polyprenol monophosphomannose synthase [Bdellovibrionales bacterium]|nr:polyprenol monophosphomannose synthase [Bdellovibrionales bacterium]